MEEENYQISLNSGIINANILSHNFFFFFCKNGETLLFFYFCRAWNSAKNDVKKNIIIESFQFHL